MYQIFPLSPENYAHSWATLKGLSLALQFNPQSTLSYDQLLEIHTALKTTPRIYNDPVSKPQDELKRITTYSNDIYEIGNIIGDTLFPGKSIRDW